MQAIQDTRLKQCRELYKSWAHQSLLGLGNNRVWSWENRITDPMRREEYEQRHKTKIAGWVQNWVGSDMGIMEIEFFLKKLTYVR